MSASVSSYYIGMSCGKRHLDAPGTLTSPRHPNLYPKSTDCEWTISTTEGKILTLRFASFDVSCVCIIYTWHVRMKAMLDSLSLQTIKKLTLQTYINSSTN